ncbi:ATP-dependent RNA helicase SUV3 [Biscogniauxia marginata]|nr:ATP-dependent RNA helicase SUV3 [Biscogniauxia marginata]
MRSFIRIAPASSSCAILAARKHAFTTSCRAARRAPSHNGKPKSRSGHYDYRDSHLDKFKGDMETSHQREFRRAYNIFRRLVMGEFDKYITGSWAWAQKKDDYEAFGVQSQGDLDRESKLFKKSIEHACDLASDKNAISKAENPLFWTLRKAFIEGDRFGLTKEIKFSFYNFLMRSRFPKNITATHKMIADFRFPYEWFPATRALQRTVHLHVGPTNSGKTYNALKALENARSGIYAGPLRLLAHEVYSRFTAKGKQCALITGEEQRIPDEDNYFRSCTVEMTPLNLLVDVAVIDEIQMIGDVERGWAWTQALLGVQAREVHLCGEERAVDLIQSLCATIGDKVVVHRYERLSGLKTMNESLRGKWTDLQKGDAVITFSRVAIHGLKKEIEIQTGKRCAVVYGSLPPETRAQQAALFNNPDNEYDYLAASDAIGMGLNLEIRRVIFEQTHKRSKFGFRQLTVSEIKQIGGRAGRYRTASHAIQSGAQENSNAEAVSPPKQVGLVTAWEDEDLAVIIDAFNRNPEPLETAGIQPPPAVIERFSSYFPPNTPFSYILVRLRSICGLSPMYHLCDLKEMLEIADTIQPFPMSVYDRCVFLNAPVNIRERAGEKVLQAFARCVSNMDGGHLLDIPELNLELLDVKKEDFADPATYLPQLESLHKAITLYLWLSYRYSGVFGSQNLAFHVKSIVEAKIDASLAEVGVAGEKRRARLEAIRKSAKARKREQRKVLGEEVEDDPRHEVPGEWREEGHEEPLFDGPPKFQQITRVRLGPQKKQSEWGS